MTPRRRSGGILMILLQSCKQRGYQKKNNWRSNEFSKIKRKILVIAMTFVGIKCLITSSIDSCYFAKIFCKQDFIESQPLIKSLNIVVRIFFLQVSPSVRQNQPKTSTFKTSRLRTPPPHSPARWVADGWWSPRTWRKVKITHLMM